MWYNKYLWPHISPPPPPTLEGAISHSGNTPNLYQMEQKEKIGRRESRRGGGDFKTFYPVC